MCSVLFKRYKNSYNKSMPARVRVKTKKRLEEACAQNQLCAGLLPDGNLGYFFTFKKAFMGEFHEHFFFVQDAYCTESMRKAFYAQIKKSALQMKKATAKAEKVTRMAIEVSAEDEKSKKHFQKKGVLTYIELLGNTKHGLAILKKEEAPKGIRIALLQRRISTN